MRFDGRVALVTGGGSGIGAAVCRLLADEGAVVGVADVERTRAEEVAAALGPRGVALEADVSDEQSVQAAVDELVGAAGRLDYVVANAGINGVWAPLGDLDPAEWDRTIAVNLRGTFLTVRQALPALRRQGGAIVVTSSVQGTREFSHTGATAYACSKAAQLAFVKMTSVELAKDGIRINAVCPGAVATNLGDNTETRNTDDIGVAVEYLEGGPQALTGLMLEPEDVARAVLFLLSDDAGAVTGSPLWVDGAESIVVG